jgi:hypothetical protein
VSDRTPPDRTSPEPPERGEHEGHAPRAQPGPGVPTGGMAVLAAGRFVAELGLLAALGVVGWHAGSASVGTWLGVVLAAGLPLAAAAVWARWVAPRARARLDDPARLAVEVVLFAAAAAGLALVGHPWPAVALAAVWAATAFAGRSGY